VEKILRDGVQPESAAIGFLRADDSTVVAAVLAANGHEPSFADLPADWAEEIRRNLRFFEERGGLDEVRPLYFPPPFKTPWNGVERTFSPIDLQGKIFMAGLTGEGTIDLNPMPFEISYPMVGLHSTALNTILTRGFLRRASTGEAYALLFVFSLAAGFVCAFFGPLASLIGCVLLLGLHTLLAITAWRSHGLWIPWVAPTLVIALIYLQEIAMELIRAARARQKIRSIFSTMVSPSVLKLMEDEPDRFSLTGERKPATIFFSGIEGFQEVMRREAPDELSAILSFYLTPTSEIIMEYGGYIDKYEGHIIMADFGVPLDDDDHAWKCCFAAIEQQMDIRAFELFVLARYGVDVTVHMGLNSGFVSAGNMGSEQKMQYTVMGDAVNVAARFRPANGIYDSRIISGEAIEPLVRDRVELRMLDRLLLKGKTVPTTLYEVMGWKEEAYLAFRRGQPLPESLLARWRVAPPEKIFGYARWWRAMETERAAAGGQAVPPAPGTALLGGAAPMAGEIAAFFEARFDLAERIMLHAAAVMVERMAASLLLLSAGVRPEKSFSRADAFFGGDWHETLDRWRGEVEEIQRRIETPATEDAGIDELLRSEWRLQAQTLHGKIRSLQENLDKKSRSGLDVVDRILASIRERLEGKMLENAMERLGELQGEWRREAERFVKTLARRADEYHGLMARLGALSDARRKVREFYEEGLRLHWNRDWEAALAQLEEARRLDPADGPTRELVARIEGYRLAPPPASWQGEFVQRKK
jgi:class 3 adenylate cyclase